MGQIVINEGDTYTIEDADDITLVDVEPAPEPDDEPSERWNTWKIAYERWIVSGD